MSFEDQTFILGVYYLVQQGWKFTSLFDLEAAFYDGDLFEHGSYFHLAKSIL